MSLCKRLSFPAWLFPSRVARRARWENFGEKISNRFSSCLVSHPHTPTFNLASNTSQNNLSDIDDYILIRFFCQQAWFISRWHKSLRVPISGRRRRLIENKISQHVFVGYVMSRISTLFCATNKLLRSKYLRGKTKMRNSLYTRTMRETNVDGAQKSQGRRREISWKIRDSRDEVSRSARKDVNNIAAVHLAAGCLSLGQAAC